MNQLTKVFDGKKLRIINLKNEPWFVAKDVCNILELTNPSKAVSRLDEDERSNFKLGRQGEANIVNEFGLYNLILGSRKLEAKQFKRWITHEVIPSIRKTGVYQTEQPRNQLEILQSTVNELVIQDKRITNLEETMRIDGGQEHTLNKKAKQVVVDFLGGKRSPAYKKLGFKAFSEFWRDFKNHFEIPRYGDLPKKRFDDGLRFIEIWQPSTSLKIEIDNANYQQIVQDVI
ncbi:ORF6C domain-containing protein [Lentibacillus sp. Marseille-P4043]|uniref:ORF6C domain-containing protein n=1 Tax=Lentibacillus sp. Marseille-P4043 TaxID=2040293 RepID=UPI000D0B0C2E|nr:ORF6C domain-containing protein [Lentibacillus sp. Marseille-P4043]